MRQRKVDDDVGVGGVFLSQDKEVVYMVEKEVNGSTRSYHL